MKVVGARRFFSSLPLGRPPTTHHRLASLFAPFAGLVLSTLRHFLPVLIPVSYLPLPSGLPEILSCTEFCVRARVAFASVSFVSVFFFNFARFGGGLSYNSFPFVCM